MSDAEREDQRGARDKGAFIWAAGNEDRLTEWVDGLQAVGQYTFVLAAAATAVGRPATEAKQACSALVNRARIVCPQDGFYVIVPLEYRAAACPPPSWFIDDWMKWSGSEYAVALLTSAALYGAGHQQAQAFQVLVPVHREDVVLGRVRIQFVADERVSTLTVAHVKTDTGTMRVVTPEETSLSLVRHAPEVGGTDAAASVLVELVERIDPALLREAADRSLIPTVQRLGYILSVIGAHEEASVLESILDQRDHVPVWLRSEAPVDGGVAVDVPWLVAVERPVELDQ
jgi:hypothetical protein